MREPQAHRSTAWPLSLVALALVAYASFYPLSGWAWPPGSVFRWWLPKLPHEVTNDLSANVLGYLPLGAIWCLAHLRSGRRPWVAAVLALLTCSGWSYAIELVQHFLPSRVPSVMDWLLNTLGAAWGVLLALTLHALGWVNTWHRWRVQWLGRQMGGGLALMLLWPVGLLTPLATPLGEGRVLPRLHQMLAEAASGSVWAEAVVPSAPEFWLRLQWRVHQSALWEELELATVVAGALLPMCVAASLTWHRRFRITVFALTVLAAFGVTSLSSGLNFGLNHALAWLTLPGIWGLQVAAVAGWGLLYLRPRWAAALGLVMAVLLVVLVHLAPADPYYAQALHSWERGLFIRFHGLTRWIGQLWPWVAAGWLVARVMAKPATRTLPVAAAGASPKT